MGHNSLHQGSKAGNGTGAEIIPVTEASGKNHQITVPDDRFLVPEHNGRKSKDFLKGHACVQIAIGSRKNSNTYFHGECFRSTKLCASEEKVIFGMDTKTVLQQSIAD
jgi:hypothetical protein